MAIASNFPAIKPSLLLDFANTQKLDSRITFTRTTTATYYDGVTTAKAEENLLLQSQDFATTWGNVSTTETVDSVAAPDGTTTADTITATAGLSSHSVFQTVTVPTGTIVVSVFAKAGTHNYIQLFLSTQTGTYANFDLTAGAGATGTSSGVVSTSITSVGNDWYRCVMIFTQSNATAVQIALVSSSSAARADSWTALGTETVYLWGAQLEQRSSVTAYTATTTQAITNYIPVLLTAASGVARFDHNPTTDESLGLLIEEARTNLVTYSAQFDNAVWLKTDASVTANTIVAPDGTVTGDSLIENATLNAHRVRQNISVTSGVTYTISVFAKASIRTFLQLFFNSTEFGSNAFANFNLSTGALGTVGSASTAVITSVGNGWYRCSMSAAATATGAASSGLIQIVTSGTAARNETYTGDGYSGLFIWGAQLEAGAFPTSYIATTSATVTRNADAATMTGSNFTSWYNQGEGTLYAEFSAPNTEANTRIVVGVNDGTTSEWIVIGKASNNRSTSEVYDGGAAQVLLSSAAGNLVSTSGKVSFAYKVNDFAASTNSLLDGTDTSGTLPTVSQMNIGDRATGSRQLNGTIKKIAYYPLRVTNAQLQALTS